MGVNVAPARGAARICELDEVGDTAASTSARELLDEHFTDRNLGALLGTEEPRALALARRATQEPLGRALSRPGKGIRARLVAHAHAVAAELAPGHAPALPPALPHLLELLHVGSLIVDDVEDDAQQRRGAPALHRQVGAPLAINAGNFLYFLPLLALDELDLDDARALAMHRRIARSLTRCHHGQGLDLSLRVSDIPRAELAQAVELSTRLKTGALLELSCALGAIAARASKPVEDALTRFGCEAGVALQMFDDLSGFLNPARRAKALEDLVERRPTWAWALAAARVDDATFTAWQRLDREVALGSRESLHALLAAMTPQLQPLRAEPRARLEQALADLQRAVGDLHAIAPLAQELRALEHGYV